MLFKRIIIILLFLISEVRAAIHYPYLSDTKLNLKYIESMKVFRGDMYVVNPGEHNWLVQTWTEDDTKKRFPYTVPGLARLEAYSRLKLTTFLNDDDYLHQKWFVVMLIPSAKEQPKNSIAIPVAYKMKLNKV
jgi:hypothetical protein